MRTIKDINIKDKKVIIRCDFNVPIKDGKIIDETRLVGALPTIEYALSQNSKIILMSHLGRVKEETDLEKNNLAPVAIRLSELLNRKVKFVNATRGKILEDAVNQMQSGDIILMQNTRYEDLDGKKESSNDESLGKYWASLADAYINDAFGTIHRAHASNVGIPSNLKEASAFGFLIEKELKALSILDNPERPFVVILGGAKVADKIGVITNLVEKADKILIGGGMAFTFLKAEGYPIGKSLLDSENLDFCKEIISKYKNKIILPIDAAVSHEFTNDEKYVEKAIEDIADDEMGLDIGSESVKLFESHLIDAKSVVWNGPLGVYEFYKYKKNTDILLKYLVDNNIKTILGGGDIVAAAGVANLKDKIYHASTGGGATLEYLEGKKLPGIEAIK